MDEPTPPQSTTAKNLEMMQLEKFSPAQINFNQKDFSLEFSIKCDFDLHTNLVIFKALTGPSAGEYFLNFLAYGGLKYPRVNFMIDFFGRGDQGHGQSQSQSQIDIKQDQTKQEQITFCLFKNSNLIILTKSLKIYKLNLCNLIKNKIFIEAEFLTSLNDASTTPEECFEKCYSMVGDFDVNFSRFSLFMSYRKFLVRVDGHFAQTTNSYKSTKKLLTYPEKSVPINENSIKLLTNANILYVYNNLDQRIHLFRFNSSKNTFRHMRHSCIIENLIDIKLINNNCFLLILVELKGEKYEKALKGRNGSSNGIRLFQYQYFTGDFIRAKYHFKFMTLNNEDASYYPICLAGSETAFMNFNSEEGIKISGFKVFSWGIF